MAAISGKAKAVPTGPEELLAIDGLTQARSMASVAA
jgi:hypothetical protein